VQNGWKLGSERGQIGNDTAPQSARAPGKQTLVEQMGYPSAPARAATPQVGGAPPPQLDDPQARLARLFGSPASAAGGLPAGVRGKMERSFDADFSAVRVHQGGEASAAGAEALARGDDLHFRPGAYDPDSSAGQELIGHELAHVVQQRAGRVAQPQAKGGMVVDAGLEAESDAAGARAARGEPAGIAGGRASGGGGGGVAQPKLFLG
jgi:hypothetical protein